MLRAVVKVALEATPLGVPGKDDPRARSAEVLEPRLRFGMQPLVLQREACDGDDLVGELRIVEKAGAMSEQRELLPPAHQRRRFALERRDTAAGVDKSSVRERVGKLQRRVSKRLRQRATETACGRGFDEVDDEPRDGGASSAHADPAPGDGEREPDQHRGLAKPQRAVGGIHA